MDPNNVMPSQQVTKRITCLPICLWSYLEAVVITLFRFTSMLCGTGNISMDYSLIFPMFVLNLGHIHEHFCEIMSFPQNIVMDLNDVMY